MSQGEASELSSANPGPVMALFFDVAWFDAKLDEKSLSRRVLAAAAGMSEADLALVYKDQRELSGAEVAIFAELLGTPAAEIARQAGVSTPVPGNDLEARVATLERRVAELEAAVRPIAPR